MYRVIESVMTIALAIFGVVYLLFLIFGFQNFSYRLLGILPSELTQSQLIEPSTPSYQLSQEDQRKVDEMGNHFSISPTGNHCVFLYLDNREQLPCEEASDVINRAYRQLIHEDLIFAYEDLAPEYAKKIDEIRREHTFNIRKNDNRCHLNIESNDKVISANIEQDCKDVDKTINKYYELMVVGKL